MKVCITLHGFNVRDKGKDSTDKLGIRLSQKGVKWIQMDYRWVFLLGAKYLNSSLSKRLDKTVAEEKEKGVSEVIVIGHSNGCAIAMRQMLHGSTVADKYILINPALKRDLVERIPGDVKKIVCYHSRHDYPTQAAKWASKIPVVNFLIPELWGAAGAWGLDSDDLRVKNIEENRIFGDNYVLHSDVFADETIDKFSEHVYNEIMS